MNQSSIEQSYLAFSPEFVQNLLKINKKSKQSVCFLHGFLIFI